MEKIIKEEKKLSFRQKLLKAVRMTLWKRKTFIGGYHENEKEVAKFITDNNVIIVHIDRGNDRIHQFDFRLADTRAQKKDRKLILFYIRDHAILRFIGYTLHATTGWVYRDNGFCRMLGFKNNMLERMKYGN